jgi:hypothetical protein
MSKDTAPGPAIPLETLIPLLPEQCLDPRAAGILELDENFQRLQIRRHQIFHVDDRMDLRLHVPISINSLATGFGYGRDRVKKHLHMV